MAEKEILNKIVNMLDNMGKKIDDMDTRLRQLEKKQETSDRVRKTQETLTSAQTTISLRDSYESSKLANSLQADWGKQISPAQANLIRFMANASCPTHTVYDLKDQLNFSRSYIITLLDQLEQIGLVQRIPNIENRVFKKGEHEVSPRHLYKLSNELPEELNNIIPGLEH